MDIAVSRCQTSSAGVDSPQASPARALTPSYEPTLHSVSQPLIGLALALSSVGAFGPLSALAAQEAETPARCTTGRISNVFVDNKSIFDVDDLEDGAIGWVYGLANGLHVRTNGGFIRREVLFDVGDCFDPMLLDESGRILRSYPFISRADVFAVEQADGTMHVVIDTQDQWSTQVDLGASFDDGFNLEVVDVTERNLLGRGILASGFLRTEKERRDRGVRFEFPRFFGTRLNTYGAVGETRDGNFLEVGADYPFVGEVGRFGARQLFRRRDELFPYALGADSEFSHVLLPMTDERAEFSVARRWGEPGRLTMLGVGIFREELSFAGGAGAAEVAVDNDFGNTSPAPTTFIEALRPQANPLSATRFNLLVGQRNLRFVRVRGLDALAGQQDVRLGSDIGLTLGRTVSFLSSDQPGRSIDNYSRLRLFLGHDPGSSYLFFNLAAEGRRRIGDPIGSDPWRDLIGEFDLYSYLKSTRVPGHTVFARVSGSGGWRMETPFQLTGGGRGGVRGYTEEDDPGGRRLLLTLEDRIFVGWPAPDLLDMGFTVFGDLGRVWPGDTPFGDDSGWRTAVGGGLRVGFPAGSRGLLRVDVAFPIGTDSSRSPIWRVTLQEQLGIITGFFDHQLDRSRRVSVGPDFFVTEVR